MNTPSANPYVPPRPHSLAALPALVAEARDVLAVTHLADADPARADVGVPVLVLGGEPERMALALTLPGVAEGTRDLVASAGAADDLVALGGDCDAPRVRCVDPVPATTGSWACENSVRPRETV